jgi:hypothetical protein
MTLAKKTFYVASSLLLAGAMSVAQSGQGSTPSVGSEDQDSSMAGQAAGAVLRGCLSGSADNYTLTDHNGTIYHLVGASSQLLNSVGHEVQVAGTPDARRTGATDDAATNTASSFQVTGVNDMASTCNHRGSRSGTMSESPSNPDTDSHPKGAPGEGAPPQPQAEPEPHLMALLQQPASSGTMQDNSSSPSVSTPATINSQDAQSVGATGTGQATTPPPVTNETPATAGAASTAPTTTTTPDTSGTSMSTTGTSTTSGAAASGQTQNDPNKPLYERQATDVPWAGRSGANNSNTTTTTTTTPQSQSQPQPQPQPHQ